ncbi:YtxH domain-containing protein [Paenibacillus koleovorans]|uniref:YtxH domain-containing protein n=1 Tax=Paenibacillus koleovorans TaxID=121608 RepID=UPI000FDBACC9|nr:YtxH domain-containing protein [Paenibacillus koleovorans]
MSNSESGGRGKDFLVGAVIGSVLGAITALLLAPKSGKELRADLSEQVSNVSEKTQQIASEVSNRTQGIVKQVSSHTGDWVQKAKEVASSVSEEVRAWKDARHEVAATSEELMPADAEVLLPKDMKRE